MSPVLRVLQLEDSAADAELIEAEFVGAGFRLVGSRVEDEQGFREALGAFEPDLVISDHSLGRFRACDALDLVQSQRPHIPFIVVTGAFDEDTAVEALRAGADNYVLKQNLGRLIPAVQRSLAIRERLRELTPRQLEVFRLVADGLSTRQIAETLGISIKTVETHRTALMKRLDVHDVVALVRYAVRVRLVRP